MFAVMHAVNVSVCLNVRVAGNYTMLLIQYENSRRVSRLAVESNLHRHVNVLRLR